MNKLCATVAAAAGITLAMPAAAATVTSLRGATNVDIPALNQTRVTGPVTFGPGITFTSTVGSAFGWTQGYGFGSGGYWSDFPMIGLDAAEGSFTLTFPTAIRGFVADTSWSTYFADVDATISAYDAAGSLLESVNLENGFRPGTIGFARAAADIASIRYSNEYVGIQTIAIAGAVGAVPEPATWAMLIGGFGLVGRAARRRRVRVAFA